MRCRNETDGFGDFECLYGFPCNTDTGECDCLGSDVFVHDTGLFVIPNCGMPIPAITATYVVAVAGALFTCFASIYTATGRKRTTRHFLWVGALWTFLLAVLQCVHFLEGRRFGPASIALFYLTIQVVNVQVIMFTFQIISLLALLAKPVVLVRLRRFMVRWLAFWSFLKILPAALILVAEVTGNDDLFNSVVFAWAVLLMAEVSINTTCQYMGIVRLIRELDKIPSDQTSYFNSEKVQAVLQFSDRLRKVLPIASMYAVLVAVLCCVLFGLYGRFGFGIPHAWVWYMLMVISWPMLGFQCVLLSKDATVKQIEKLDPTDPKEHTFSLFEDRGKNIRKPHLTLQPIAGPLKPSMIDMAIPETPANQNAPQLQNTPSFSFLKSSSNSDLLSTNAANPRFIHGSPTPISDNVLTQAISSNSSFLQQQSGRLPLIETSDEPQEIS